MTDSPAPPSAVSFDRATGRLTGAGMLERGTALAMKLGSAITRPLGFRGYSVGCRVLSAVLPSRTLVVRLNEDALFACPFTDGYWSLLLNRDYTYEAEIDLVLRGLVGVDYTFIDCGANFGLWSVLASSKPYGAHPALAVEPSSRTLRWLRENARLNGGRFQVLHAAVGAEVGQAQLRGAKHEARSIAEGEGPGETVAVSTLDTFLAPYLDAGKRLVIKLDVEGAEIASIEGGKRLFEADAVLVYEDHGHDRSHAVSRHVMSATPYKLFVFDPQSGRIERLESLSTLDRIKSNPAVGYNVFATASPFWEERLLATPPRPR